MCSAKTENTEEHSECTIATGKQVCCDIFPGKDWHLDNNMKASNSINNIDDREKDERNGSKCETTEAETKTDQETSNGTSGCQHGLNSWCRRYFWEGQDTEDFVASEASEKKRLSWKERLSSQKRKIIGFLVPASVFHFFWWAYFIKYNNWSFFLTNYPISITMIFGSMIAGMTSVGGGAVAYPVMTLALNITPSEARDFSLMIQSCGMTAASFSIFYMRVCLEWNCLIWSSLGGVGGMIFGLHIVDPALEPRTKKLGFVSIWFAFGIVLFALNVSRRRRTLRTIPNFNWWRALVLTAFGFVGGIFSAFSGSGIDVCAFTGLTLLFRISEKTATPTSVILMAANALVGFYWRGVMVGAVGSEAWRSLAVCVPVVVLGAPLGSVIGTHMHRVVLGTMVVVLTTVSLVSAYVIIRPRSPTLIGGCVGLTAGCVVVFAVLAYLGKRLLAQTDDDVGADQLDGKPEAETADGRDNRAFKPEADFLTSL